MMTSSIETNHDSSFRQLSDTIQATAAEGRYSLIVLGAGCSVSAKLPTMRDLYSDILRRVTAPERSLASSYSISELKNWLLALQGHTAPRSVAAKALGMLQSAQEASSNELEVFLESVWSSFSMDFLTGNIHQYTDAKDAAFPQTHMPIWDRSPTPFHLAVANWVLQRKAIAVSVNFDGLTRKAIRATSESASDKCVILSTPNQLERFFLGNTAASSSAELFPLIKVWGDVFHAVCLNTRCPEYGSQTPIYELQHDFQLRHRIQPNPDDAPESNCHDTELRKDLERGLQCEQCGSQRRLQLHFPGYEAKERNTHQLMISLRKYLAPRIGNVIIAGFSGIWDDALTTFLVHLTGELQKHGSTNRCYCIDLDPHVHIATLLSSHGIKVNHIIAKTDQIESSLSEKYTKRFDGRESYAGDCSASFRWSQVVTTSDHIKRPPHGYSEMLSPHFAIELSRLGQLGLKSRLHLPRQKEADSTRLEHMRGAINIAWFWTATLLGNQKRESKTYSVQSSLLQSIAVLATA
ncbi:MAG: hypothetical protein JWM11_4058, partial [Planctomycetaceae bacterium]|nr:hypothetical protein [Planctomycetaceae bacterium]